MHTRMNLREGTERGRGRVGKGERREGGRERGGREGGRERVDGEGGNEDMLHTNFVNFIPRPCPASHYRKMGGD